MKQFICLVAIIAIAYGKNSVSQTTQKFSATANAKQHGTVSVEWDNGPSFRQKKTSLATVEMVDNNVLGAQLENSGDIHQSQETAKMMFELKTAITQIVGDIQRKIGDLRSEIDWVGAVKNVMLDFHTKVQMTKDAIKHKKKKLKKLLKKKRQLENLVLQLQLEEKMAEAKRDLSTLNTALRGVQEKKEGFLINHAEVNATVAAITDELKKLNGGTMPDFDKTASTDSATNTDSASASSVLPG